jgi:RNA recognition motif-containing protein
MPTHIYVGNLSFFTRSTDLCSLFAEHGEVTSAQVVDDHESRRSLGFGFVEMTSATAARRAVAATNGTTVHGRELKVNLARPGGN